MRVSVILGCLFFLLTACDNSEQIALDTFESIEDYALETQIEASLKEKYNEPFIVDNQYFEIGLNAYVFTAHPKANKDISFEGNYDERAAAVEDRILSDAYPNMKFSYEAAQFYQSLFQGKAFTYVADASVYTPYEHSWGNDIPSFDEYLTKRSPSSTIRMNTYFFDITDGPEDKMIVFQKDLLQSLFDKYQNNFSLYIGYWPKGFIEDKEFKELTFGFEATSDKDADNLLNTMQYLSKVFFIKIVNGSIDELDEQRLYELVKPDKKHGMNPMVEL